MRCRFLTCGHDWPAASVESASPAAPLWNRSMGEALESRPNLVVEGVMLKLCYAIPVICLIVSPLRAQTIEAVGAEKCRSGQGAFSVSFVAPEDAQLEATAKAKGAEGTTDTTRDTA